MTTWNRRAAVLVALALAGAACTDGGDADPAATPSATDTTAPAALDGTRGDVVTRGALRCGVVGQRPGFAVSDGDDTVQGLDGDLCRAIAAAILGDSTSVDFVELTEQEQFTALAAATVDVLLGVPVTATGDGVEAVTFSRPTFYDGQGVMVLETSEVQALADLEGLTVCSFAGSADDDEGSAALAGLGISVTPLPFPDANRLMPAFESGECQAATANRTRLAELRDEANSAIRILPATITQRPLAIGTREDDAQFSQIIDWTVNGLLLAEQSGINSTNLATFTDSSDPAVQRLLGLATDGGSSFDAGLGLPDEWLQDVIRQVGNYAEIYTRNLGAGSPVGLARAGTVNELWRSGGLHYPLPYR